MLGRGKTLESTVGKPADSRFRRCPRELEFSHMACISAALLAPAAVCCAAALCCAVAMSNLSRIAQKNAFGCHRIGVTNSRGGLLRLLPEPLPWSELVIVRGRALAGPRSFHRIDLGDEIGERPEFGRQVAPTSLRPQRQHRRD